MAYQDAYAPYKLPPAGSLNAAAPSADELKAKKDSDMWKFVASIAPYAGMAIGGGIGAAVGGGVPGAAIGASLGNAAGSAIGGAADQHGQAEMDPYTVQRQQDQSRRQALMQAIMSAQR